MSRKIWRNFDFVLFISMLLLISLGIGMIHSATLDSRGPRVSLWEDVTFRQVIYAVGGLIVLFIVAGIDYRFYQDASRLMYGFGLALLLLLFLFGHASFGARSWFNLQVFPIQPSELIKIILILTLAKCFADRQERIHEFPSLIVSLIYVAVPIILVYLQPDFGTALILGAIWLGMAWTAGIALWQFGLLGLGGVLAAPTAWFLLKPYMRNRIVAFFNPQHDPSGESYNVMQALISIGSGGLWGKGFAHGTQSQLHFLRVRHTDFIFSVYAEELGFIGSVLLLGLFLVLLLRILRAATLARDRYGQLIASGVATMIFAQSFINLAVNLNLLPATGLPLPFVSYGGSSLLAMLIGIGLVQSVVMRHKKLEFE